MDDSRLPSSPADSQSLEDLACASWSSDTLFAALELNLFGWLGEETLPLPRLAHAARCRPAPLARLLTALEGLALVQQDERGWRNSAKTLRHLLPDKPEYLGDFLRYRRYLQPTWHNLAETVAGRSLPPALSRDDDYPTRNLHYVRALDQLARLKAHEISTVLDRVPWQGPVLDIGGGAGSLSRTLLRACRRQTSHVTLFDLPEVLNAARTLYPDPADWEGITPLAGEFLTHEFAGATGFGLIIIANFLHIYPEADAQRCLAKACSLLDPGGHLVIHDYFPDRGTLKGRLYDLNMLINTAAGQCHRARDLAAWLSAAHLLAPEIVDLASDSALIVARRPPC